MSAADRALVVTNAKRLVDVGMGLKTNQPLRVTQIRMLDLSFPPMDSYDLRMIPDWLLWPTYEFERLVLTTGALARLADLRQCMDGELLRNLSRYIKSPVLNALMALPLDAQRSRPEPLSLLALCRLGGAVIAQFSRPNHRPIIHTRSGGDVQSGVSLDEAQKLACHALMIITNPGVVLLS